MLTSLVSALLLQSRLNPARSNHRRRQPHQLATAKGMRGLISGWVNGMSIKPGGMPRSPTAG